MEYDILLDIYGNEIFVLWNKVNFITCPSACSLLPILRCTPLFWLDWIEKRIGVLNRRRTIATDRWTDRYGRTRACQFRKRKQNNERSRRNQSRVVRSLGSSPNDF